MLELESPFDESASAKKFVRHCLPTFKWKLNKNWSKNDARFPTIQRTV